MNELENQLRNLGEAAEADVSPVAVSDIITSGHVAAATDIGVEQHLPRTTRRKPRRGASLALAAAVLLVVAATGVVVLPGSSSEPGVDLASQTDTDSTIVAPTGDNGWAKLRFCEATGDYTTDTGNTFYGAYQLTRETFDDGAQTLRYGDYVGTNPAHAPAYIQDAVANAVFLERGAGPWPVCGFYIEGPMITPVVPHWLDESDGSGELVVFLDPGSTDEDISAVASEIDALLLADPAASYVFIDQDQAYEDFQAMFIGNHEMARASVAPEDMPPSFQLTTSLPPMQNQLRSIDGVFEVISPIDHTSGWVQGPLRISIPAIDLNVPVRLSPTIEHQEQGLVAMVNQPDVLAIAGFGSFSGSAFERLDKLRDDDRVIISTSVNNSGSVYEIVRTFRVTIDSAGDAPDVDEVEYLLLRHGPSGLRQRLVLVADVAGQPDKRVVIRADQIEAFDGYVTSGG